MELREMGRTGMRVSPLGFGGSEIGHQNTAPDQVERLLNAALDAGLNVIDTAECYRASEEKIGRAVSHRRSDYFLFTKCGHHPTWDDPAWKPDQIAASIERSLKRLRTDVLDLVQLHSCSLDLLKQGDVIRALQQAQRQGKTRFIGYSGDSTAAKFAVESGAFDALQISISVADQEALDLVLPAARERHMGVIAKRPIANAAWRTCDAPPDNSYHTEYWRRLRALDFDFLKTAPAPGIAPGIALRFTLSQPGVHTAIVGTTKPGRWSENAQLLDAGPLPQTDIDSIRARWRHVAKPDWIGQT